MSASELEAFLVEMEPDIRVAERDMQEIEALEKKGVTGAGKLGGEAQLFACSSSYTTRKFLDYEALQPRLDALLKAHHDDLELAASLEKRVARLMESHATQVRIFCGLPGVRSQPLHSQVDALSELFVAWDDTVMDAEDKVMRLERDRLERQRLGFE